MTAALIARSLTIQYGDNVAVRDATLEVGTGCMVAVAGANGAGKSTLVNGLAGWSRGQPKVSGRILLNGQDIEKLPAHERSRRGLQLVPEGKNVFGDLTVDENLSLVRTSDDAAGRYLFSRDQVIELFPRLHERRTHKGSALSGGERQMLAMARALLAGPKVLILDEPSVGLAPRLIGEVLSVVRKLVDRGLPVLVVDQNVRAVLDVADDLYLLERGSIVAHGSAESMRHDDRIMKAYLGELAMAGAAS